MISDVCKMKDVCIHFLDPILQISSIIQKNERLLKHGDAMSQKYTRMINKQIKR